MNPTNQPDDGKSTPLVVTLNLRGQTKMQLSKLLQIEELLKTTKPATVSYTHLTLPTTPYV